jgi:histidyl-tRNA synthetase
MTNKDEPVRPEARLPKGFSDISAGEIRATETMLATIRGVFESYGFEPFDTPALEYSDALGKFLPDQDRPNEGVFSFKDDDDQWLSLRYDLTAPLARYVAENYQNLPKPFRRYQAGPVWRNEKPGPGRFRQFTQFDADTVGASSVAADAELCMLAADTLEALGVERGQYVVKFNSRSVLDGVMDAAKIREVDRLAVLRALDKYDRLGESGVVELLSDGRRDESGDFTKGVGLARNQIELLLEWLKVIISASVLQRESPEDMSGVRAWTDPSGTTWYFKIDNRRTIKQLEARFGSYPTASVGLQRLSEMNSLIEAAGYMSDKIAIDPSVVRGLEYYTGPVFEAELTAPIKDERGQPIRLGSVVSGGRYDGLIERFTGEKVPATGISIGVSRLLFGLQRLGKYKDSVAQGPVVVLVFPDQPIENYQRLVNRLRKPDDGDPPIRAEMYLGSGKIGAQTKYADKRGSPCVVIQGGDERAKGEVTIKDLILGATLTSIKDRDEYLKKQAEAQFAVPEAQLVEKVRGVLSRHKA